MEVERKCGTNNWMEFFGNLMDAGRMSLRLDQRFGIPIIEVRIQTHACMDATPHCELVWYSLYLYLTYHTHMHVWFKLANKNWNIIIWWRHLFRNLHVVLPSRSLSIICTGFQLQDRNMILGKEWVLRYSLKWFTRCSGRQCGLHPVFQEKCPKRIRSQHADQWRCWQVLIISI